jgi:DNA-binding MarR family transcriptional regulator
MKKAWQDLSDFEREQKEKVSREEESQKLKRGVWVRVPKKWWLNELKELTPLERCVLIELRQYRSVEGECYPTQKTIARDLRVSENTALKGIKGLLKKKFIKKGKKNPRRNFYVLNHSSLT